MWGISIKFRLKAPISIKTIQLCYYWVIVLSTSLTTAYRSFFCKLVLYESCLGNLVKHTPTHTQANTQKKQPQVPMSTLPPPILRLTWHEPLRFKSQSFAFSSFFLLCLFLRRSTHSSWGLLRRQSRAWLNRSGSLPALCVCVCVCVFSQACVHIQAVWLERFISGRREQPVAFTSHITFSPSRLLHLLAHIFSSLSFFSLAFM